MSEQDDNTLQIKTRIWFARERAFLGPGGIELLRRIDQAGNVREACEKMGLSYSKGRKIIRLMEAELGEAVVLRQAGGTNGGAAHLTECGYSLIRAYEELDREIAEYARQEFERRFPAGRMSTHTKR